MDSYYKLSLQIPRYIIALSTEWISVEDVDLFEQVSQTLRTTEESCIQHASNNSSSSSNGPSASGLEAANKGKPKDNVRINLVMPEHQDLADPNSAESVYHSGWCTVEEKGVECDIDGIKTIFSEMKEKFVKRRSEMENLPVTKMREYAGLVASELDAIADELPAGGILLDVIWLMPTSTDFPIMERADAFLFSALRRLEVWHHARITILLGKGLEGQDHPSLVSWKTFIECRAIELRAVDGKEVEVGDILKESASLAWQGQVKYISSRGTAFAPWPGFSLHRLADDSHRSEPFIEILDPNTDSKDVAGSQSSLDDSFMSTLCHLVKSKYVVNETFEFIHLANLHEIPSWFVLPGKFELRLRDKERTQGYSRSSFWMHYLTHRLPEDGQGVICQLSCLETDDYVPEAQSVGLTTRIWTENIKNNPLNPDTPKVQLKGTRHTFFFLLHGDRRGRCIALPLVSPFMLNGAAHAILARHEDQEQSTENEVESQPAREVLDALPTITGPQLRDDEEELARMQIKALAMVLEKIRSEGLEMNVTPSLLIFLFNYMRKVYYDGYSIDSPASQRPPQQDETTSTEQTASSQMQSGSEGVTTDGQRESGDRRQALAEAGTVNESSTRVDLSGLPTELSQSPSDWLERQALQNRESIAHRLRRYESDDYTLAGMPVPAPECTTITFSAKEFRSYFKPNGQPKEDKLAIVPPSSGLRQSPRTRSASAGTHSSGPSVQELMHTDFSESLNLKYHGISYCRETPDSQTIDLKMQKLQQRYIRQEMSCTFTSDQRPTLAIRTKRKELDSPSKQKAKVRKLSASAKKKSSINTRQGTPKKRVMPGRTAKTPQKGVISTPKKVSTTPNSRKKRARISTSGGLTPKRQKRSTPLKSSKPEEMASPRRSARKLARDLHPSTSTNTTFITPSTSSYRPTSASSSLTAASTTPSKRIKKPIRDSVKSDEEKKRRTGSSTSESRSEKHKRKLRSIVEETLAARGIDSSHPCYKPCVTRLYTQTKMFVNDLKSTKGLYVEMKKIAEANADFVISFEQSRASSTS